MRPQRGKQQRRQRKAHVLRGARQSVDHEGKLDHVSQDGGGPGEADPPRGERGRGGEMSSRAARLGRFGGRKPPGMAAVRVRSAPGVVKIRSSGTMLSRGSSAFHPRPVSGVVSPFYNAGPGVGQTFLSGGQTFRSGWEELRRRGLRQGRMTRRKGGAAHPDSGLSRSRTRGSLAGGRQLAVFSRQPLEVWRGQGWERAAKGIASLCQRPAGGSPKLKLRQMRGAECLN